MWTLHFASPTGNHFKGFQIARPDVVKDMWHFNMVNGLPEPLQ